MQVGLAQSSAIPIWHLLSDERSRRAVEVAERFAEGVATATDLHDALGPAWQAYHDTERAWIASLRTGLPGPVNAAYQTTMAAEAVGYLVKEECPRVSHRGDFSRGELVLPVVTDTASAACRAVHGQEGLA